MKIKLIVILLIGFLNLPLFAVRHIELYTHFFNNDCGGTQTVELIFVDGTNDFKNSINWGIGTEIFRFYEYGGWNGYGINATEDVTDLRSYWFPSNGCYLEPETIHLTNEENQTYHFYKAIYEMDIFRSVKFHNSADITTHDNSYFTITGQMRITTGITGHGALFTLNGPGHSSEHFFTTVQDDGAWHNFKIEFNEAYASHNFFLEPGSTNISVAIFAPTGGDVRNVNLRNIKINFEYVPNLNAQITSYNTNDDTYHPKISWNISDFPNAWRYDFDVQIWRQLSPIVGSPSDWILLDTKSLTDTYYIDYSLKSPSGQGGLFAQEGTAYYKIKLKHKTSALNYDICPYYPDDQEWINSFDFSNEVNISYGTETSNGIPSTRSSNKGINNITISGTTVSFTINDDKALSTKVEIYNLKGQKVKKISTNPLKNGRYSFTWNGLNDNGKSLSSGIYFYKISRGKYKYIKKTFLVK